MLRRIETKYSQGDYEQADVWCRLAMHYIFGKSGTSNIGKLQRSLQIGRKRMLHLTKVQKAASVRAGQSRLRYMLRNPSSIVQVNRMRNIHSVPALQNSPKIQQFRFGLSALPPSYSKLTSSQQSNVSMQLARYLKMTLLYFMHVF